MPKAISPDLRMRILRAVAAGMSQRAAARRFEVASSTVTGWLTRLRKLGCPQPRHAAPHPPPPAARDRRPSRLPARPAEGRPGPHDRGTARGACGRGLRRELVHGADLPQAQRRQAQEGPPARPPPQAAPEAPRRRSAGRGERPEALEPGPIISVPGARRRTQLSCPPPGRCFRSGVGVWRRLAASRSGHALALSPRAGPWRWGGFRRNSTVFRK